MGLILMRKIGFVKHHPDLDPGWCGSHELSSLALNLGGAVPASRPTEPWVFNPRFPGQPQIQAQGVSGDSELESLGGD